MKKKVIDILPPEKRKTESVVSPQTKKEAFSKEPQIEFVSVDIKDSEKKAKKSINLRKGFKIGIPVSLLVLIFVAYFFIPVKAEIKVFPATETLTFTTILTVKKEASSIDFNNKVIPGALFEKEKTVTDTLAATGEEYKEQKASGVIRIYNEDSTSPQTLVASTRFVSVNGELFRTPKKVTIEGGHYEGGKFIPGETDVEVVADKPGEEYNIEPSAFSIPGFAGTSKYTKFYGRSFQAMSGGSSDVVSLVTKKDLEDAEDTLTARLRTESLTDVKIELATDQWSGYEFSEKAIKVEIIDKGSFKEAGDPAATFDYQVKGNIKVLLFKKEDLTTFVKGFIESEIADDKAFFEQGLDIDFSVESVSFEGDEVVLFLDMSAEVYSEINLESLKSTLKNKSMAEITGLLNNQLGVARVETSFSPFWIRKVPEDLNNIELNLSFEQ